MKRISIQLSVYIYLIMIKYKYTFICFWISIIFKLKANKLDYSVFLYTYIIYYFYIPVKKIYYSNVYTRSCTPVCWTRALQRYPNIMSYDTFGSFIITSCLEVGRCRVSFSLNFKTAEYDRIPLQASRLQTRLRA
jgi:hypothetical protein